MPAEARAQAVVQAAFRDLHGARLHGFALLVTLGDREAAAAAAADAMSAAMPRLAELRHPERAAAWLRRRVLASFAGLRSAAAPDAERRATLRTLGVAGPAFDGLAALTILERAVLVTTAIERLDPRDVEQVLGRSTSDVRRLVEGARRRYLAAAQAAMNHEPSTLPVPVGPDAGGEIAKRVEAVAARTIGSGWRSR